MKKTKVNTKPYFVKYVVDTTPRIRFYKDKKTMDLFLEGFKEAIDHSGAVSWIDMVGRGELFELDVREVVGEA